MDDVEGGVVRRSLAISVVTVSVALLAACDLDPSFGEGGVVLTDLSPFGDITSATSVVIDVQGRIVVAGFGTPEDAGGSDIDFTVIRYTPSGDLDRSFGNGGKVFTDFGGETDDFANGVALDAQGRIVVAGCSACFFSSGGRFALARYLPNGDLDTSFDNDGKVTTVLGTNGDLAEDVTIDSRGRVVAVGSSHTGADNDVAVVRYRRDGSLDSRFGGGDGIVTTGVGNWNDWGKSVAIDAAGKIVVAGRNFTFDLTPHGFVVLRYRRNGSLDTSFSGDGKVITDYPGRTEEGEAVAIDSAGRLLVAGSSRGREVSRFLVVRYLPNGSVDTTFGNGGRRLTDVGPGLDFAQDVAIDADDSVLVIGWTREGVGGRWPPNPPYGFAVARYRSTGALDTSFSDDGKAVADLDGDPSDDGARGEAGAIDAAGRIIVAGGRQFEEFAVARFVGPQP